MKTLLTIIFVLVFVQACKGENEESNLTPSEPSRAPVNTLSDRLNDALDSINMEKIAITNIGAKKHLDRIDPALSKAAKAFINSLGHPDKLADASMCVKKRVESDWEISATCLSEHYSETQGGFSYLAVAAKPYEDDWTEPAEYHAATAYLKFFIFRGPISLENKLAESDFVPAGDYGTPTSSIKLIKFKRSGPLGWAVEDGWANNGYGGAWTVIYGLTRDKINAIVNITSYASNADSFMDTLPDDSPELVVMDSSLFLIENDATEYFSIEASADGISHGINTHLDTQFHFSESSNSYVVSDEYEKLFDLYKLE